MPPTRPRDNTCDLACTLGVTATMAATARAVATRNGDPLMNDPFAEPLVHAMGNAFLTRLVRGELAPMDIDDDAGRGVQRMVRAMAVRTRYFDEYVTEAARAGVGQVVILASGLDSRAYRLPWPPGTTVFEIDRPQVVWFKTVALAELGVRPTARSRLLAVDPRRDWPAVLRRAGLRTDRPTAWIAEGLLGHLPPDAADRLLDDITALSAKGSRLAVDSVPNLSQPDQDRFRQRIQTLIQRWHDDGFDVDMTDMVYQGDHNDVAEYLRVHGWEAVRASTPELSVANGLGQVAQDDDWAPFPLAVCISATLT
jgi:methyltransferase (TIGR00027 family)